MGNRDLMGVQKISLHESGRWRFACTDQASPFFVPEGIDRVIETWTRPQPGAAEWTRAVTVTVPGADVITMGPVRRNKTALKAIHWLPKPDFDHALAFDIVVARPVGQEVALTGLFPVDSFFVNRMDGDGEVCLLIVSVHRASDEQNALLEERRTMLRSEAKARGAAPHSMTLRGFVYNSSEDGTRRFWDLSVFQGGSTSEGPTGAR